MTLQANCLNWIRSKGQIKVNVNWVHDFSKPRNFIRMSTSWVKSNFFKLFITIQNSNFYPLRLVNDFNSIIQFITLSTFLWSISTVASSLLLFLGQLVEYIHFEWNCMFLRFIHIIVDEECKSARVDCTAVSGELVVRCTVVVLQFGRNVDQRIQWL